MDNNRSISALPYNLPLTASIPVPPASASQLHGNAYESSPDIPRKSPPKNSLLKRRPTRDRSASILLMNQPFA